MTLGGYTYMAVPLGSEIVYIINIKIVTMNVDITRYTGR